MKVVNDLDQLAVNTIRTLAMDAVQRANSGHPGTPMALAPVAHVIFDRILRHAPTNPDLPDRDRFVLSVGHASMLLYGTLHLQGYDVSLEDIRNFRQLHSSCAGHPEFGECPGVETTTGPLGQGVANSVGMAIAKRRAAHLFNRPGHELFDWQVVALCGDGDLMEGVAAEAASLAGHLRLSELTWVYDANRITIEGDTDLAFTEDVGARFVACGWAVETVEDANDLGALTAALERARARDDRPSLVIVRSHIAFGSPSMQDKCDAHGAPLGEEEIRRTKEVYGWDPDAHFLVPTELEETRRQARERGEKLEAAWNEKLARYREAFPEDAANLDLFLAGELPAGWDADLPVFPADPKGQAGRAAFGKALNAVAPKVPWMMGGSADLGSSNKTTINGAPSFLADRPDGRNLHFGVREHAMGAIANGMALSGLRAFTGTFFVFSDYMRPAIRMAALMKLPVTFVFTHDSIGVGEDGPTHQPIEHLPSLRAMPGLVVLRPGDANEAVEAWRYCLEETERPVALLLSRQNHPTLDRTRYAAAEGLQRGAYVLADSTEDGVPDLILIGSGSELGLVVEAYETLVAEGRRVRAVSMPSWEIFDRQDSAYREAVLPAAVEARVAIEAASTFGWERHVGRFGVAIGHDDFGASAPGSVLFREFGLTAEAVAAAGRALLGED
ncbi:MAG: transketolase [Planctomycetota bacterium]